MKSSTDLLSRRTSTRTHVRGSDRRFALAACGVLLTSLSTAPAQGPTHPTTSPLINISLDRTPQTTPTFRVSGTDYSPTEWRNAFAVYVEAPGGSVTTGQPPILGFHRIESGALVFEPRFPLEPGMRYRAVLRLSGSAEPIVKVFQIPEAPPEPPTVVEHIYPSSNRLPENQLKFYLHFSAPMSREQFRELQHRQLRGRDIRLAVVGLDLPGEIDGATGTE